MIAIDTGPLVALCDGRDEKHRTALKHLSTLRYESFTICEAVLTEACFHLPHDSQRRRLRDILGELYVQPRPPVGQVRMFWHEVLEWLEKYADHEPDWADGCLAVLCGYDRQLKVWTFDREFRTTWRRPDGTAIPLAIRTQ